MSAPGRAYIAGVGMITPIGLDAAMTAASVQAGLNRFHESEYRNRSMQPMIMSSIPDEALPEVSHKVTPEKEGTYRHGRMLLAGHVAMDEILGQYQADALPPLFLAGPEADPENGPVISTVFLEYLALQSGAALDTAGSRIVSTGRAGGLECIDLGLRYLHDLNQEYVLIGGVDSYQDAELLAALDREERIHAEGVLNGFIPGEAAAFVLLCRRKENARPVNGRVISVRAPGTAQEPGHLYSEQPYQGEGLSQAFERALTGVEPTPLAAVYSSMNGEQHWAKEYGVAALRYAEYLSDRTGLEHPADCYGDIGAASGIVLTWLAGHSLAEAGSDTPSLVYCSSDRGFRAAACVAVEPV